MSDAIADALHRLARARYFNEDQLQEAAARVITEAGFDVQREVRLSPRDRIDLLAGRVGIEVKVDGGTAAVLRQLTRYAQSGQVDELILLTSRARHQMPAQIDGIPVRVVSLITGGL